MAINDSGINTASNINDVSGQSTRLIDDEVTTAGVIYIGYAKINSFDKKAQAIWAIKKIVKSVTGVTEGSTTWADGNSKEDNIWNNRASLTYN
jgi:hypothetical protein